MSSPIPTVIADDEPLARRALLQLAAGDPELMVIGEGRNGVETRRLLEGQQVQLLLLDIEMPGGNGFTAIRDLAQPPVTVFVTAHAEHAVRAFDVEAVDYLLKPFDDERFSRAMARAKAEVRRRWPPAREGAARIALPGPRGTTLVAADEIDWIEAADYYASVHVGGREHLLRESLASLELRLDEHAFVRIHRSVLVNIDRIRSIESKAVVLHDGTRLQVSRRRREHLRARLRP